jgi:hypothetical protein
MKRTARGKELLERGKGLKNLACQCGRDVEVDVETVAVKCCMCVMKQIPLEPEIQKEEKKPLPEGFPQGWRWMKQFVHADGRVFEKGVENIALKGTLPLSVILSKFERRKRRDQRAEKKLLRLAKKHKKAKQALEMNDARGEIL